VITEKPRSGHGPDANVLVPSDSGASQEPAPGQTPADFESVYAEWFGFVWRNLRRLGVAEALLRDAAQDVFLVVHRRLGDFEGRGTLRSWLYSIVRRVAADYRRHRHRHPDAELGADSLADVRDPGPEGQTMRGENLELLLRLLEELDEDKRDVLVLVDLEEMTMTEAADALGANPNTLYSRLRAARQQMREGLERFPHPSRQP